MLRMVGLGLGVLLVGSACATFGGDREHDRAGTTTTTGASASAEDVEMYVARAPSMKKGCGLDLTHTIHFEGRDALSPREAADVDEWAACLTRPEMRDATVVLTGAVEPSLDGDPAFLRRAQAIRDELARRGVEPSRVLFGASNASRGGGRIGRSDDVRVEVSSSSTLRALR